MKYKMYRFLKSKGTRLPYVSNMSQVCFILVGPFRRFDFIPKLSGNLSYLLIKFGKHNLQKSLLN